MKKREKKKRVIKVTSTPKRKSVATLHRQAHDEDRLTSYDKVNLPLRGLSAAQNTSREIRSWINLGGKLLSL